VTEAEEANNDYAQAGPQISAANGKQSQDWDGKENDGFHCRQPRITHPDQPSNDHGSDKGQRKQHDPAAAVLHHQNAHSEHRRQMVPTVERVAKTILPAIS
jgi:hypothetical protein